VWNFSTPVVDLNTWPLPGGSGNLNDAIGRV